LIKSRAISSLYWVILLCATQATLRASTSFINFEDLPDAYFFSSGGQNIDDFYTGVTFGPYVTGLSVSRFGGYDDSGFPPHSGDVVIWSPFDDPMTVSFSSDETEVSFWYTSLNPITITGYDASDDLLGSVMGDANTDGTTGVSSYLEFDGVGIASVDVSSAAGQYVIDDLTFSNGTTSTPEPTSMFLVLVGLMLLLSARIRRIQQFNSYAGSRASAQPVGYCMREVHEQNRQRQ
jgi:hypothetical protein